MLETALAREREQLREKYHKEGIQKGEYIGTILTLQRILRRPVSEERTLREHDLDALQQMLQELETALKDSSIMS